jgi:hypothetical protein
LFPLHHPNSPPTDSRSFGECQAGFQVAGSAPPIVLDEEAASEVGGQLGQSGVGLLLADRDADQTGRLVLRLAAQADESTLAQCPTAL